MFCSVETSVFTGSFGSSSTFAKIEAAVKTDLTIETEFSTKSESVFTGSFGSSSTFAKIEAAVKTDLTIETEFSTKSESGTKVN